MSKHTFSMLCLGDSYTIGESLSLNESFPYQTIQQLRNSGHSFYAPEIIAKTGFTTFELAEQILHTSFLTHYDFVTLLIGVNNQYRGLSAEEYKDDFEFLIKKAIHLAAENAEHVMVLSIPDWGITPFAKERDKLNIAKEIDAFNKVNFEMSAMHKTKYLNITESTRKVADDKTLWASDGLHPSGMEYRKWAALIAESIGQST